MTDKDKPADTPELPAPPPGFTQADTDVDDFPAWDFKKYGELVGTVLKKKTVELERNNRAVDVGMCVVVDKNGETFLLWESANLSAFFDEVEAGSEIVVQPAGVRNMKGNKTMNLFNAYYK